MFNVSENPSTPVQHLRLNGDHPGPGSIDLEGNRLITPVEYYDQGSTESIGALMYEFDGSDWVETAIFSPFDITGSDWAGYIMDLDGDRVLMTSPRDSDLGLSTGSAYIWDYDGTDWVRLEKGEEQRQFQQKFATMRNAGDDLHGTDTVF